MMLRSTPFHFVSAEAAFTVVVPFFNEKDNVEAVCLELNAALRASMPGGDVVLIDDGSDDGTGEILDRLAAGRMQCRVFHLEKNQGQSAALLFGFSKATAPVVVTMDGDGQNDPNDILRLLTRLQEADMVVGARTNRQDSWIRRKISRIANFVRSERLGDHVSDSGCALKAFRREVMSAFIPIRTLYSFMPALAVAAGFRVVEEPVQHRPRLHGRSNYSVASFLILPIVDFIGLEWFRSRRCPNEPAATATGDLGVDLYRRARRRWRRRISYALAIGLLLCLFVLLPRRTVGPAAHRISLGRAERIALHLDPQGRLGTEELSTESRRLTWTIDVQLPGGKDLDEIKIDAVNGGVIARRIETAEEEAREVAGENAPFDPKHPFRQ